MKEDRNLIAMIALLVLLIWATETLLYRKNVDDLYQWGAIAILLLIGLVAWEKIDPEIKEKQDPPKTESEPVKPS